MKKTLFITCMLAFAFCGCTFDAGNYITKSYGLDGSYTKLEVEDAFTVTVSDTATQIYITAGENIMPKIIVLFDNNKLCRSYPVAFVGGKKNITSKDSIVYLTAADSDDEYHK